MKNFEIKNTEKNKWLASLNEFSKFTCHFEDKRFNYERTFALFPDPTGNLNEI